MKPASLDSAIRKTRALGRALLPVALLWLIFSGGSTQAAATEPYGKQAIARKDYRGITLNALTLDTPVLGEPFVLHAREFEKLTGVKINITRVGFPDFYAETLLGLKNNKYDVVTYGSMWIADVLDYLAPIPDKMLASEQYREVLPHYKSVARWGDVAYQVPIDGDRHYLQYRHDLLTDPQYQKEFFKQTGKPLEVPKTWPQLQEIAAFFQNKPLAGGARIYGLAEVTVSDALLGNYFIKRAAPYAKHPDVKGGFYFDLETMEPLINTPGFVEALKDFVAAQGLYPPGGRQMSFFDVIKTFGRNNVVFSDSWDDPFIEAMEEGNPLRNRVRAALSPGSTKVWNRQTKQWDHFDKVNHAPYVVYGWTGGVAKASRHQEAAFDFLGYYANRENHRKDMLVGRFGMNPFRYSDLDATFWVKQAGWDREVAESYVGMLRDMTNSRNRILDLRIHRGQEYVYLLSVGVYRALTGRDTPQRALDVVAERWRELTRRIGVEKQRQAYRHVVGFEDGIE